MAVPVFSHLRKLSGLAFVGILATVGYGYAAGNTVPPSNAGDGVGAVSGFTVSNIHYGLNTSSPQNLATLDFDINPVMPAGGAVRVSINGGSTWLPAGDCTASGADVTCTISGTVTVTSVTDLRVVAAQ